MTKLAQMKSSTGLLTALVVHVSVSLYLLLTYMVPAEQGRRRQGTERRGKEVNMPFVKYPSSGVISTFTDFVHFDRTIMALSFDKLLALWIDFYVLLFHS